MIMYTKKGNLKLNDGINLSDNLLVIAIIITLFSKKYIKTEKNKPKNIS